MTRETAGSMLWIAVLLQILAVALFVVTMAGYSVAGYAAAGATALAVASFIESTRQRLLARGQDVPVTMLLRQGLGWIAITGSTLSVCLGILAGKWGFYPVAICCLSVAVLLLRPRGGQRGT